jgi:hypothetical protein
MRQRERIELQRIRREISASVICWSIATAVCTLLLLAGLLVAPWGHGWFAIALFCWISGGVCGLFCGGFLIGSLADAWRYR